MKAVRIHEYGGVDKLIYEDIDFPECKDNEVIINVKATSVNHLDLWVRAGTPGIYNKLPLILGSDAAGKIVKIGKDVNNCKVDDEVILQPGLYCSKCLYCKKGKENYCNKYAIMGETQNGTNAEFIAVNQKYVFHKPLNLSFEEAASMPLVYMTAYEMIVNRAKLKSNEFILIYGGTSGVGSAAIQICNDIGANIISTSSNNIKCDISKNNGAHYTINHNDSNWINNINSITKNNGVDVVFEHVGYKTWTNSLKILAKGGRIVTCGSTTGANVEINLAHLFIKQQSILGSTMGSVDTLKKILHKIEINKYKPIIDKIFKMKDVKCAHSYMQSNKHLGKIVLIP